MPVLEVEAAKYAEIGEKIERGLKIVPSLYDIPTQVSVEAPDSRDRLILRFLYLDQEAEIEGFKTARLGIMLGKQSGKVVAIHFYEPVSTEEIITSLLADINALLSKPVGFSQKANFAIISKLMEDLKSFLLSKKNQTSE